MDYCSNSFVRFYELFGIILLFFKCFIPLLIIIFGTFDLFGLVLKSKERSIKKFILRIISGIIIFFLPTLIIIVFERVGLDKGDYSCMYNCVLDINKCEYKD